MISHEFWRETTTGKVWAVELREGVVTGCCGPLTVGELEDEFLAFFDYSSVDAAAVEASREEYDVYQPGALHV
jgi:hypothetical protein